jgi:hypothetical protein
VKTYQEFLGDDEDSGVVHHELQQAHDAAKDVRELELTDALEQKVPRMRGAALPADYVHVLVHHAQHGLAHTRAVEAADEHVLGSPNLNHGLCKVLVQKRRVLGFPVASVDWIKK